LRSLRRLLGWAATKPLTTTAPGFLVAGVLGTLMLFLLARTLHTGWPARALAWVGEGSLGVFLLSGYFQGGTRAVVFHVVHTNPWAQLLLTSLGATLFPAWIYNNRLKWRIDWLFVAPWGGRQPVRRTAPQVDLSTR
jgi:fucose 4-O-acetylase-like acetyltransferase